MTTRYAVSGIALGAALFLGSCSTTSFLGLAKANYVEEELGKVEGTASELDRIEARLDELSVLDERVSELDGDLSTRLDEMNAGIDARMNEVGEDMERLRTADAETAGRMDGLETLAAEFREEMDGMSESTLRDLMAAIEAHLEARADAGD